MTFNVYLPVKYIYIDTNVQIYFLVYISNEFNISKTGRGGEGMEEGNEIWPHKGHVYQ